MTEDDKFTIGRSRKCDIVLADDSVSRVHAELICLRDGLLFLTDCHSSNGTTLIKDGREKPLRQEFVCRKDALRFGDVRMDVAKLLDAVPRKLKYADESFISDAPPEPLPKPWVRGDRLLRCRCGAVKPKNGLCQECGK